MYLCKNIKVEDQTLILQIWDTAGQEKYKAIAPVYLRDSDIVIFVCDLARKDTYFGLNDWVSMAKNYSDQTASWMFLGNKSDQPTEQWEMSEKNLSDLATKHNERTSGAYFLTSGKTYQGILELTAALGKIAHKKLRDRAKGEGSGLSTRLRKKMGMKDTKDKKSKCC